MPPADESQEAQTQLPLPQTSQTPHSESISGGPQPPGTSATTDTSSGTSDGVSRQVPAATSGSSLLSGQEEPRSANGFPIGAVAGGAIGTLGTAAILAGVGVLLFCLVRRHMRAPPATTVFIISDEKGKCKEKEIKEEDSARNESASQIVPSAPPPSYYLATHRAEAAATIAPPLYEQVS